MAGPVKRSLLLRLLCFMDRIACGFLVGVLAVLVFLWASSACAAETVIPRAALPHKAALIRAAHAEMGLNAPVALLAAQIHTESLWRPGVTSHAGAQGLAQFMPSTASWLPTVAPHTGEPLPFNPGWSLRALCAYDKWIYQRVSSTASPCHRWAFTLCGYNGGLGWVHRDRALASSKGCDASRYWGHVEYVNAGRRASAFRENRNYPQRIFRLQRAYEQAGWGPGVTCD